MFKQRRVAWVTLWLLVLTLVVIANTVHDKVAAPNKAAVGTVVAYYENDYQKYAVDKLMQRNQIQEWYCLWSLWTKESNWRPKAYNHATSAYGIGQLLPSTYRNIKFKRSSNPYRQVDAGLAYIDRHWGGSPCRAYASELARGWY